MRQVTLNPLFRYQSCSQYDRAARCAQYSYDPAARCSQYDCAARYILHTKTVVMLAIYFHNVSMESKYTDQVYLDLCLFIPAVKIRGEGYRGGCQIHLGIWYRDAKSPRAYYSGRGIQIHYDTVLELYAITHVRIQWNIRRKDTLVTALLPFFGGCPYRGGS